MMGLLRPFLLVAALGGIGISLMDQTVRGEPMNAIENTEAQAFPAKHGVEPEPGCRIRRVDAGIEFGLRREVVERYGAKAIVLVGVCRPRAF